MQGWAILIIDFSWVLFKGGGPVSIVNSRGALLKLLTLPVNEGTQYTETAQLFAEKLSQIFDKAENDNNRRAGQSDEEEDGEKLHSEVRDRIHMAILRAQLGFATSL
jgi:hypothetical protein